MNSPEQIAIKKHLSKPRPFPSACCCMGPQVIDRNSGEPTRGYTFQISKIGNRLNTLQAFRECFGFSLSQTIALVDEMRAFTVEWISYDKIRKMSNILQEVGTDISIIDHYTKGKYPVCPCAMDWVEEVDGNFYKIEEIRSHSGITHSTEFLGPVGGPYVVNKHY